MAACSQSFESPVPLIRTARGSCSFICLSQLTTPLTVDRVVLDGNNTISPRLLGFIYFDQPFPHPANEKLLSASLSKTRKSKPIDLPTVSSFPSMMRHSYSLVLPFVVIATSMMSQFAFFANGS